MEIRRVNPIMAFFQYSHLPDALKDISAPICELAAAIDRTIPESAEKSAGLRKLLEAKDCFVRAAMVPAVVDQAPDPTAGGQVDRTVAAPAQDVGDGIPF